MADNTNTPNTYLHKIKAPSLSDGVGYVKSLENSIEQINENFKTLASLPFMQGVKGDSYELVEKPIWNNGLLTKEGADLLNSIFSDLVSASPLREKMAFGTVRNTLIKKIYNISKQDSKKTYYCPIDSFYENSKLVNNTLYFYAIKTDSGKYTESYLGQMYYFVDGRIKSLSEMYTNNTEDLEIFNDYTGFYQYNPNGAWNSMYSKVGIVPNLYYDNSSNDICWSFNGTKTGLTAIGPKGEDGSSASMFFVKCKKTDNDGIADILSVFVGKNKNKLNESVWSDDKEKLAEIHDSAVLVIYLVNDGEFYFGKKIASSAYYDTTTRVPFDINDTKLENMLKNRNYLPLKKTNNSVGENEYHVLSVLDTYSAHNNLVLSSEKIDSNGIRTQHPTTYQNTSTPVSKFILNDYDIVVQDSLDINANYSDVGEDNLNVSDYTHSYTRISHQKFEMGYAMPHNAYKKFSIYLNGRQNYTISGKGFSISDNESTFTNLYTKFGDCYTSDIKNGALNKLVDGNAEYISKTIEARDCLPIGTIMMYYGPVMKNVESEEKGSVGTNLVTVGNSWALCNGANISGKSGFSEYREITGKDTLPNLSGAFPVGCTNSLGIDGKQCPRGTAGGKDSFYIGQSADGLAVFEDKDSLMTWSKETLDKFGLTSNNITATGTFNSDIKSAFKDSGLDIASRNAATPMTTRNVGTNRKRSTGTTRSARTSTQNEGTPVVVQYVDANTPVVMQSVDTSTAQNYAINTYASSSSSGAVGVIGPNTLTDANAWAETLVKSATDANITSTTAQNTTTVSCANILPPYFAVHFIIKYK